MRSLRYNALEVKSEIEMATDEAEAALIRVTNGDDIKRIPNTVNQKKNIMYFSATVDRTNRI
jgi:hypothetical protein